MSPNKIDSSVPTTTNSPENQVGSVETVNQESSMPQPKPERKIESTLIAPSTKKSPKRWLVILISLSALIVLIVVGYLIFQKRQSKQKTEILAPTPTPAQLPTPTPDETANWETYIDDVYNYSVKYPSTISANLLTDNDIYLSHVIFKDLTGQENYKFSITVRKSSLEGEVNLIKSKTLGHAMVSLESETSFTKDGVSGVRLDFVPQQPGTVIPFSDVILNNRIHSFTINASTQHIDQILSTFKFLPDTSDWETYIDTKLNLTFKHPSFYKPTTTWQIPQNVHQSGTLLITEGTFFGTSLPACNNDPTIPTTENCILPGANFGLSENVTLVEINQLTTRQYHILTLDNDVVKVASFENPQFEFAISVAGMGGEQTFNQILSTFEFTGQESTDLWNLVCDKEKISDFEITVNQGEGITHVARNAVDNYFNLLNMMNAPNNTYYLTDDERVYAEDHIRKQLSLTDIYSNEMIILSCNLVEEASIKSRLLTINQKENLEQYSKNVTEFQVLELIKEVLEETSVPNGIQPIIIGP